MKEELTNIREEWNKEVVINDAFESMDVREHSNRIADFFLSLIEKKYISRRELEKWVEIYLPKERVEFKYLSPDVKEFASQLKEQLLTFLSNK